GRTAAFRPTALRPPEPAAVAVPQSVEDRVDVEVAVTQPAECLAPPDLRHRRDLADDLVDHLPARVFQVHVVDPAFPFAHLDRRVTTTKQQMARVQAQADGRELEQLLDLPHGLDVRSRLVVKGRLESPLAAASERHLNSGGESLPPFGIEAEAAIERR